MGSAFYFISIQLYILAMKVIRGFHPKARKMLLGRKNQWQEIKRRMETIRGKTIWVHCASLGEFEQGRPVIEALKKQHSDLNIVLTFFSPSGYEVRKNYPVADAIFYLPFDTPKNATRFVEMIQPSMAFFIKYEYWYYYLSALNQRHIPVISVSSIFRKGQLFFNDLFPFYRKLLHSFDHFFVQNVQSETLLRSLGIDRVTVAGDTRFDRVYEICQNRKEIPVASSFKEDMPIVVIGSSWPNDIALLNPIIKEWCGQVKFIIAPHELEEKNLTQIEAVMPGKSLRYSKAEYEQCIGCFDILIIDNMGMLSSLYQYGEYAYIGGALDHGLHNTLEAATYGIPIFFARGDKNVKYQEAMDLISHGGAFEVQNASDMTRKFAQLYNNESEYQHAARAAEQYIAGNLGATEKVMAYTDKLLAKA